MSGLWDLQLFDPSAEFTILERRLPHWSQSGAVCFITWRTLDSIPKPVLRRWHADRDHWLTRHGIDPKSPNWKEQVRQLEPPLPGQFVRTFSSRWNAQLDQCHGECVLRQSELSKVVEQSLLKFDRERYLLTDFIVMPNHIHLLAAFESEDGMLKQCEGWKHYQATQINRQLGNSGRFWQQDGFDHLVRSLEQYDAIRDYIAANPHKARLGRGEYRHYSSEITI